MYFKIRGSVPILVYELYAAPFVWMNPETLSIFIYPTGRFYHTLRYFRTVFSLTLTSSERIIIVLQLWAKQQVFCCLSLQEPDRDGLHSLPFVCVPERMFYMAATTAKPVKSAGKIPGSTLKIIAMVCMLIDHTAAVLFDRILISRGLSGGGERFGRRQHHFSLPETQL